jgi:plastocyanin
MAIRRYVRTGIVLVILAAAAVALPRIVSSREEVREVTVVVRGMTYYLDGKDEPNPSLKFSAKEQVRLTLRNEDEGMSHDFSIRSWGVGTKVLEGKGQQTITFRVPSASGSAAYSCTPHSAMMSGSIVVE